MKSAKLRYFLIVCASLLCLGTTIYVLQTPPETSEVRQSQEVRVRSVPLEQAVGMLEDSLRRAGR